jgi:hypothetical protein
MTPTAASIRPINERNSPLSLRKLICVTSAAGLTVAFGLVRVPAQAAVPAQGEAVGGPGSATCDGSVSCYAFYANGCSLDQGNDIDASARPARVGGQTLKLFWTFTPLTVSIGKVGVQLFDANCELLGAPLFLGNGQANLYRPGTAYVAVIPPNPFHALTWRLST